MHDERPSTAVVLRLEDADVHATDGPLVEGTEHVGECCIISAPDLDGGLEWGRKTTRA